MRSNLWAFLTGFVIAIVGWLAVVIAQVADLAFLAGVVAIGALAGLAGRRWIALGGAVLGMLFYPVTIVLASPNVAGDAWLLYTATFVALTTSGFAGGLALNRVLVARGVAARS
jgi:Na+/melibiose symporter-like transporter